MMKVLFVCHGNICRSPMAEAILRESSKEKNLNIEVDSCAVSGEEIGNPIYPPVQRVLNKHYQKSFKHNARQITKEDFETFDKIFIMDESNYNILSRMAYKKLDKVFFLGDYLNPKQEIEDPWYTGKFEECFYQIKEAIDNFITEVTL